jgi:hypothetical protein
MDIIIDCIFYKQDIIDSRKSVQIRKIERKSAAASSW